MPELPTLPPIAGEPISVILLAQDNASQVAERVGAWTNFLDRLGRDYELILADGGSVDDTATRAEALVASFPHLQVVRANRQGDGAALRAALAVTRFPLLAYAPCDPASRPADLGRLLARPATLTGGGLEIDHVHILSGYRAGRPLPGPLRALGWTWRLFCRVVFSYPPARLPGWLGWRGHLGWLVTRVVFGLRNRDVLCPFRLMRRHIFERIPLQADGRFAHIEILAKANFLGHLLAEEMPLEVKPAAGPAGPSLWREGYRVFNEPDFGPTHLPQPPATPEGEPVLPSTQVAGQPEATTGETTVE